MLTVFELQDKLVKEMQKIFEHDRFPNQEGKMVNLNVFKQSLPVQQSETEDNSQDELESGLLDDVAVQSPFPYMIVDLYKGKSNTQGNEGTAQFILWAGIYDDGPEKDGYQYIVNMIQKVVFYFQEKPYIGGFRISEDIEWEIEDSAQSFYFATIKFEFTTPSVDRKDDFC